MLTLAILYTLTPPYILCTHVYPSPTLVILYTLYIPIYPVYRNVSMHVFPFLYTHSLGSIGQKRLTLSNQMAQAPHQEVEFVYKYMVN